MSVIPHPNGSIMRRSALLPAPHTDTERDIQQVVDSWLLGQGSAKSSQTYSECLIRVMKVVPWRFLFTLDDDEARDVVGQLVVRYKPATVKVTIAAMSSLWNHLAKKGVTSSNPWAGQKIPNPKDTLKERVLTEKEIDELLKHAAPGRDHAFVRFLYVTGLRIAEAVTVQWNDVTWDDEDRCWLTVYGKGSKTRTVEVQSGVMAEIARLWKGRKHEGRIWEFTSRTGERILERLRGVVGKDVSPHWMRHARATHAIRHGAPLHLVQANLGHASIATTTRYLHVLPGESDATYLPEV